MPYQVEIIQRRISNIISLNEQSLVIKSVEKNPNTGLFHCEFLKQMFRTKLNDNMDTLFDIVVVKNINYKNIKSEYGEIFAKELELYISKRLLEVSSEDDVIGQLEDDLFLALVKRQDHEYREQLFYKILSDKITLKDVNIPLKLKLGVYEIKNNKESINDCIRCANKSVNLIDGNYTQFISYYNLEMKKDEEDEQFILQHMEECIEKKQLIISYTPEFDIFQKKLISFQTNIRWVHPVKGEIPLRLFKRIFEENGFINKVNEYIFHSVFSNMSTLIKANFKLVPFSFSISRHDLFRSNIANKISNLLDIYNLSPALIRIRIKENQIDLEDYETVSEIKNLYNKGFSIEIDDFGSGSNSLNLLQVIPTDFVKISSQNRIINCLSNTEFAYINFVKKFVSSLNVNVILKEVNTKTDFIKIRDLEFDLMQGNFLNKNVDFEEVKNYINLNTKQNVNTNDIEDYFVRKDQIDILNINSELEGDSILFSDNKTYHIIDISSKDIISKVRKYINNIKALIIRDQGDVNSNYEMIKLIKKFKKINSIPLILSLSDLKNKNDVYLEIGVDDIIFEPLNTKSFIFYFEKNIFYKASFVAQHETKKFKNDAYWDYLTGLLNRRGFDNILQSKIKDQHRCQYFLMILDVDNLKLIAFVIDNGEFLTINCSYLNLSDITKKNNEIQQRFSNIMYQHNILSWKYSMKDKRFIFDENSSNILKNEDIKIFKDASMDNKNIIEEDIKKAQKCIEDLHNGAKEVSTIIRFRYPDGKIHHLNIFYSVLVTEDDNNDIALGSAIDVTDIIEKENHYRDMLDIHRKQLTNNTLLNGYCNIKENNIIEMNDFTGFNLEERFGVKRDPFFIKLSEYIVNPKERKAFLDTYLSKPLVEDYKRGISQHKDRYLVSFGPDIGIKCIEINVNVISEKSNVLFGLLSVIDVSQEYIKEIAIQNITEQDFDYFGYIDIKTKKLTIFAASNVTKNILLSYDTYEEQLFNNLLPKVIESEREDAKKTNTIAGIIQGIEQNNGIYKVAYSVLNPTSNIVERKLWAFTFFSNRKEKINITRSDITRTYSKEEKQKKYLEETVVMLQKANKVKKSFLSNMSHNIRTPMNAIVGMTDIALTNLNNKEEVADCLERIKESSEFLLAILNDILDTNKIESGKEELLLVPFNNASEYKKVINAFKPSINKSKLYFKHSCEFIHPTMIGDLTKMHRILDNIMSNAIKYTPPGGTITYSFKEKPYSNPQFALCEIIVEDDGIGMDEETLNHIYEPFYRGTIANNINYSGTGLGMCIVKNLVELKGGEIKIESTLGKGTKVIIDIPVKISFEKLEEENIVDYNSFDFKGLKILLIEDNIINQKVTNKMLNKFNAVVSIADNGKKGYEMYIDPQNDFDVILMDIQMPMMNGYESAKLILKSDKYLSKNIPLIAMTANAFTEDIKKTMNVGMSAHLAKPIKINTLIDVILKFYKGNSKYEKTK